DEIDVGLARAAHGVERDRDLVAAAAERAVEVRVQVAVARRQRRRLAPGQALLRIGGGVEAAHRFAHHAAEFEERRWHLLGEARAALGVLFTRLGQLALARRFPAGDLLE